ncbi:hypothetical protein BASA61_004950 [Batrachochytrium salamandrivorans]|nr:hypothetical protein BASA61_004950 [Batrachochytrium salamandrivorans]
MRRVLDRNIQLVRDTPNAKDKIQILLLQQSNNTTVAPRHRILSIGAYRNDLVTPNRRKKVQQNLDQLDVILGSVTFEEWHQYEMESLQDAMHTYANALIEKRDPICALQSAANEKVQTKG